MDCFFCSVQLPPPEEDCLPEEMFLPATAPAKGLYTNVATAISPAKQTPAIIAAGFLNQAAGGTGRGDCCRAIK